MKAMRSLFLVLLPLSSLVAQGPMRYRYEMVHGDKQDSGGVRIARVALLTLSQRDSAGGKIAHVVIDSISSADSLVVKPIGLAAPARTGAENGFDFFVRDGLVTLLGPRRPLDGAYAGVIANNLAPLFAKRPVLKVGESRTDTAVTVDSIPAQGLLELASSRKVTRQTAATSDSFVVAKQAESYLHNRGTRVLSLSSHKTEASAVYQGEVVLRWHSTETTTSVDTGLNRPPRRTDGYEKLTLTRMP